MIANDKLKEVVNKSGFPLQKAVEREINNNTNTHGWRVHVTEHAWRNPRSGASGYIDIVVLDQFGTTTLVLECKRFIETSWVFLYGDVGQTNELTERANVWVTDPSKRIYSWSDVLATPPSHEAAICINVDEKQPNQGNRATLEQFGGELVSATEALAQEEGILNFSYHLYAGVIVTTATLKACKYKPNDISLGDGKLDKAEFEDVPYIRFRKQLSVFASNQSSPPMKIQGYDRQKIALTRERTVFIVNTLKLNDFLTKWKVNDDSLKSLERS